MEVIGLLAGAAQVSVYAFNIVSTIQDIRLAIRNGPTLLRERSQQLDVLSIVVNRIGLSPQAHNSREIEDYLRSVRDKILRLHTIIQSRFLRPTDTSVQKLRAAIACVGKNKEVEETFAALQGDCQTLNLYMALPVRPSKEEVSEQPQNQAPGFRNISDQPPQTPNELTLYRHSSLMQQTSALPPAQATSRTVKQTFNNIHSIGKGSHLSAGNYTVEAAATHGIEQDFANMTAKDGASEKVGDPISEKDAGGAGHFGQG